MLRRILEPSQDELLAEDRRLIAALSAALARFDASAEDQETLRQSAAQLDELFLLVVAGEFNAGKSVFINALLGARILEEGVTPTTTRINLVKYGPEVSREPQGPALEVVTAPVELLREINIVDTPGTNAILREHEAITRTFVPRSDMVLFVTSADRPFTESERGFLQGIREWGKKVVVVLNKIDILEGGQEVETIVGFIRENAKSLLGFEPEVFPISARRALREKERAKEAGDEASLAASRFDRLERSIVETLDENERIRLKLLNPLGVAQRLASKYLEVADGRLALLQDDFSALEDIERQLALYQEDMKREFRFRLADADNVLHELEKRGNDFFEETMRLTRIFELVNKARMKAEFERRVVADMPQRIERRVSEVIDWLVNADLRQWQAVMEHLAERRQVHADRMVGRIGGGFDVDRGRLLESVGRAAQQAVEMYDKEGESTRLAESVQIAVAGTALTEIGALGLGAVLTHVAASAAADVTGILAASAVAVLGLFIIPNRRQAAKRELGQKIAALRERLMASLTAQFDREIEGSVARINEAIAPYTRFVRAERERLEGARGDLGGVGEALARLRGRVEGL